ncbi:porin [Burkholderia sp. Ax-1724]|nr:porin [Burkholderia sp. Ax-1724]
MKRAGIAFLLTGLGVGTAQAQTSVTLYGVIDTAVRFATNANAAGNHVVEMTDGAIYGNRWGLQGKEDLGGGNKAIFVLESGFAPSSGASEQGGRLFGRQAYVGLSGNYGTLMLGRQYTIAHDVMYHFEALGFTGQEILGFESPPYDGLRFDNTLKYVKSFDGVTVSAAHSFGNSPAGFTVGSADGLGLLYATGGLMIGATYQVTHDVTSSYFNVVPAAEASKQSVLGLGASYQLSRANLYLGYFHSRMDVADYTNDTVFAGANYQLSPSLSLIGSVHYDWLEHTDVSGRRVTAYAMVDYFLSKRTDVYIEADYTHLTGAWVALNSNPGYSGSSFGNDSVTGAMVGIRHQF